jgi:CRP-like cAMP-binding protein
MVDIKSYVQILSQIPLFRGLNEGQLKKIANRLTQRKYSEGEAIITQGQGGEGLFIVVKGTAEAVRVQPDGEKFALNQFGINDFFGELALLDEGLRTASVIARSDVQCLILTRWDFKGILKIEPEMAVIMLEELAKRFRRALETL